MPTQVERVGSGERDVALRVRLATRVAQESYRFRCGELLACEARDETAAANLASRFEAAITHQQVAPWAEPVGLAGEQPPEHDSPAFQQRARDVFDRFLVL